MDVSSPESVEAAYKHVSELVPHINVLVNNAGIFSVKAFEELSFEEWKRIINVN